MRSLKIYPPNATRLVLRLSLFLMLLLPVGWAQSVATPTFVPATGASLTKFSVTVTCSTPGAVIHYTTSGADPSIYDPVIASGQSVQVTQSMTLKAKAFNGTVPSSTASTTFDVTGNISAGSQFVLALVSNGQVYGWGFQDYGCLSNNSTSPTNVLAPAVAKYSATSNIANAVQVAAGAKHSIMLDSSGNVWGFGNNLLGESGRATPSELLYASQVTSNSGGTTFLAGCTKVAAGLDFSAAVESGGFVDTWGNQLSGRLGNGSTVAGSRKFSGRVKTSASTDLGGIRDVALGKDFGLAREACALESSGALGKVWVWGNNASGNLATGNATAQSYAVNAKLSSVATAYLADAWDMDAGDDFAAVVRWKTGDSTLQGSVWTFGNRVGGRLGDNGTITGTATYPVQVQKFVGGSYSQLNGITQISCGPGHTLALDNSGKVWAWGSNVTGALGDNTLVDKKYAVKVQNPGGTGDLSNIVRVSAGGINGSPAFSTAVAIDGTIYVWGSNANGLLANGTTSTTVFAKLPVVVSQLKTLPGFPTVTLTAAVTVANRPGAATLTATVSDPQGNATISKTEFFVQGSLYSTRTVAPWTASLTALAAGTYNAYAKTTDADGNVTTSLPTTFTILPAPPSVSLNVTVTAPHVPGAVTLTATPVGTDNVVSNVKFYSQGALVGQANSAPWQVNLSTLPAGDYDFYAVATDAAAQTGTSSHVWVTIINYAPPSIGLAATVTAGSFPGAVTLTASVSDPENDVARVDFYCQDRLVGQLTSPPWVINLSNLLEGTYPVYAVATDALELSGWSSTSSFTITYDPNAANVDTDGDGLTDSTEAALGLSATDADSDGDGIPDGLDPYPNVPNTVPLSSASTLLVWTPAE